MTLEQTILEILRLVGLPGVLALGVMGVLYIRSRSNLEEAKANVVEASAQASIAKDNAETVRRIAQKSDEDIAVLMKHVLEGQQKIVGLTELVGQVRLDLTQQISQVRIQNAELQTEAKIRKESEAFLRDAVVTELKNLRQDIKEILEDGREQDTGEVPTDSGSEGSSKIPDSESEVDNIKRSDEGSTEVSFIRRGGPTR